LQTNCSPDVNSIHIGITGTPVIDPSTGTIYLVGRTWENSATVQRIHALDVTSGAEKFGGPVAIQATVPGTGWESVLGQVSFDPEVEVQRPGLLLLNGVVYVAFASFCEGDFTGWHGWVMGYNAATLSQTGAWATTPNATGGGIWMGGVSLVADVPDPVNQPFGRMFLTTGNGVFDAAPPYTASQDFGDSIVNLDLTNGVITPQDSFTADNQASLDATDRDLGAGGLLILPDSVGSVQHPHLLVQGSKSGDIFLADRDNLGGYSSAADNVVQELDGALSGGVFAAPGYWNGNLYFWASTDNLKAFSLVSGAISLAPTSISTATSAYPGATPSISANGNTNGIVWALITNANGTESLDAFDATNVATLLYSSDTAGTRDNPGIRAKFSVANVANGKVYVGGAIVYVFGSMFAVTTPSATVQGGPGSSPTATIEVGSNKGSSFTGAVALSATGLPAGVTASFSPPTVTLGKAPSSGSSVMTLQITGTMAAGNYPFNVIGSSGTLLSSLALGLTVGATVPNVVGLTQGDATTAITDAGLVLGTVMQQPSSTVASGNVISQSPVAGTSVNTGSAVSLVVSSGPGQVSVPNVVGDTQAAATTVITGASLVLGTVTQQSSSTVASGNVISESPVAGTSVNTGSAVNLVVSSGPAQVSVPNVVGDTQAAATTAITGAGLVLGTVTQQSSSTVASGNVISESPVAGMSVNPGSAVNLVVSTGVGATPAVVSVTPNPATGVSNTFALTYSDSSGYASLKFVDVIFGVGTGLSNTCYVTYAPASKLLYLYNNAGTGLSSIAIPGSGTLSNSQCTISGSGTSVVTSGSNLTLNLAVTASSTYTGLQTIFMNAIDNSTASTGWLNEGTWTPAANQPPTVVSVSPNPATGSSNTFALVYSDPNGAGDLKFVDVIFGVGTGASNTCYVTYAPASNLLYLYNNAGTVLSSITPGSGTLSNNQCTITGSGTSVVRSGDNLTLNLAVTASSTYTATVNMFLEAIDNSAATTGWVNEGTWTP
jgi:beta-lactam-binding protein with PASTA domain